MKIFKDEPRYGEIYAYRTLKPWWALIFRRHVGYVGKTRNPAARHVEHTQGGGRYDQVAKGWSDLDPKRYVLWSSQRVRNWRLALAEFVFIRLTLPVYNVALNKDNPRRIKPRRAAEYRRGRDAGRRYAAEIRPGHVLLALTITAILIGAHHAFA